MLSVAGVQNLLSVLTYTFFRSQVAALSSGDLVKVMACQLTSSMNYSRAIWTLFFQKFAAPLDEALEAYSNTVGNVE